MKHSENKGKKTVVLGASTNADRYAYTAVGMLTSKGFEAVPVGLEPGTIHGIPIKIYPEPVEGVHTVTIYINPARQRSLYNYIFSLKPKRLILNPGAENPELEQLAAEKGIEVLNACTLVLTSIGAY